MKIKGKELTNLFYLSTLFGISIDGTILYYNDEDDIAEHVALLIANQMLVDYDNIIREEFGHSFDIDDRFDATELTMAVNLVLHDNIIGVDRIEIVRRFISALKHLFSKAKEVIMYNDLDDELLKDFSKGYVYPVCKKIDRKEVNDFIEIVTSDVETWVNHNGWEIVAVSAKRKPDKYTKLFTIVKENKYYIVKVTIYLNGETHVNEYCAIAYCKKGKRYEGTEYQKEIKFKIFTR